MNISQELLWCNGFLFPGGGGYHCCQELLKRQERDKEETKQHQDKFIPIPDHPLPTTPPIIPSHFPTQCLIEVKHLGLWYFTNQDLEHAKNTAAHVNPDALVPTTNPDSHTMTWVPSSLQMSPTLVQDRDLTMEDLFFAVLHLIEAFRTTTGLKTESRTTLTSSTASSHTLLIIPQYHQGAGSHPLPGLAVTQLAPCNHHQEGGMAP
ncbi:hypothetical protein M422DRAFT_248868 [Sphaerobolus stellatus SS14]|nr:hypothetical protein M422DRAFT_248868 [Sphaerobolus stellatus SS14]